MTNRNMKMPDINNTIYQLKEEVKRADYIDLDYLDCVDVNVLKDALALLKLREAKLVVDIHKQYNNVLNPNAPWVGKCPKCGKKIDGRNLTRFCKYCGQEVKWE